MIFHIAIAEDKEIAIAATKLLTVEKSIILRILINNIVALKLLYVRNFLSPSGFVKKSYFFKEAQIIQENQVII